MRMGMNRNSEHFTLYAAFAVFILFTYFGYSPPYFHYLPMLAKARDPSLFPNDIFLVDSTYMKASVFYAFLGLTQLKIENDLLGLALHLVVSAGLVAGATVAVRRCMAGGDRTVALLAVLISCFFYTKLVEGARASPTSFVTSTPTGIGHAFGMAALFLGLCRRPGLAAMAATLCIAVAPKGNILIVPALVLWLLLDRSLPRWALAWALLPLVYVAKMALGTGGGVAPELKVFMTDVILRREEEDAVFTQQPLLVNLLLPAGCAWAVYMARRIQDPTLRAWLWALALPTAGGWLLMLVFPRLAQTFPIAILPMLSIPQSTKYLIWLVLTLVTVLTLRSERLNSLEKLLGLGALFALRPFPLHFAITAALVAVAALAHFLRRRGWEPPLPSWASPALVLAPLLIIFVLARSGTSYYGPQFMDRVGFAHTGSWSSGVFADEATWAAWESLAPLPDFLLMTIYERRNFTGAPGLAAQALKSRWTIHRAASIAARKSEFNQIPVHGYNNPNLWFEAQRREIVTSRLLGHLDRGEPIAPDRLGTLPATKEGVPVTIDSSIEDFLTVRHVAVLVPAELDHLFPAHLPRRNVRDQVLIGFGIAP